MLTEYQYDLPPSVNDQRLSFSGLDYFVMALALLSVLAGMFYCTYQIMCGMKKRRRISFEGERIASKTVSQIVGEGDEDLIDYYL